MTVTDIIRDAVAKFDDSHFLRATDMDANISVAEIDLEGKILFIFNNLPTISNTAGSGVMSAYPIQIQILELADEDDNTEQGDDIRGNLIPIADTLFSTLQKDPRHSLAEYAENYDIDLQGEVKIYDGIFTGVMLEFDLFINVTKLCSA